MKLSRPKLPGSGENGFSHSPNSGEMKEDGENGCGPFQTLAKTPVVFFPSYKSVKFDFG
jgi:hypothetical protein